MMADFDAEIDQVTAGISKVKLRLGPISDFGRAFKKITRFVEHIRGVKIPHDELSVTNTLAGPFTRGGILVLLQEPRRYHPWSRGAAEVIADCKALQSLDEGIRLGSEGNLTLEQHVSLLDARPFLVKADNAHLDSDTWEGLYDLVFAAIEAKQPDILLCMGKVAVNALDARLGSLQANVWKCIKIIRAAHPSHSVNYHDEDVRLRQDLLKSICEACYSLDGKWDDNTWQERYAVNKLHVPSVISTPSSWSADLTDVKRVMRFLDVVMMLCFKPNYRLPTASLGPGAKTHFQLQEWQHNWLSYSRKFESADIGSERHSRTVLIPIFEQMNRYVRKISWFLPTYAINLHSVQVTLLGLTPMFENACFTLASGMEYYMDTQQITEGCGGEGDHSLVCLMKRMDRITTQASGLWEDRSQIVRRNVRFIGSSKVMPMK
ncbi:hypothetical protein GQ44DRAFT_763883 [Phaeosphaeriaceae sp. PMI808]|nr:hypothetical protein GQ44DRAFT_763883 [Phaeosphaeriaceae sp. PMI808]